MKTIRSSLHFLGYEMINTILSRFKVKEKKIIVIYYDFLAEHKIYLEEFLDTSNIWPHWCKKQMTSLYKIDFLCFTEASQSYSFGE